MRSRSATDHVLVAGAGDWLPAALRAVLEPEGLTLEHADTTSSLQLALEQRSPSLVIVAAGYPDRPVPVLCAEIAAREGGLPLLACSNESWSEGDEEETLRAGAWELLREPVRSRDLMPRLSRLIEIGRLLDTRRRVPVATGGPVVEFDYLLHSIHMLRGLATRSGHSVAVTVIGPTDRTSAVADWRHVATRLLGRCARQSDVGAWIDDADLAIVAYGADPGAATRMVDRLRGRVASELSGCALSAGVAELEPVSERSRDVGRGRRNERLAAASALAASRTALARARRAGGGILQAEAD